MSEILQELKDLEQEVQDFPLLIRTVRSAIEDITHPIGKENARKAIREVRSFLVEIDEAPATERSPTNFILPPPFNEDHNFPLFI